MQKIDTSPGYLVLARYIASPVRLSPKLCYGSEVLLRFRADGLLGQHWRLCGHLPMGCLPHCRADLAGQCSSVALNLPVISATHVTDHQIDRDALVASRQCIDNDTQGRKDHEPSASFSALFWSSLLASSSLSSKMHATSSHEGCAYTERLQS